MAGTGCGEEPARDQPASAPAQSVQNEGPATVPTVEGFFDAAFEGDTAAVGAALDAGLPVDLTNPQGSTPLMLAEKDETKEEKTS